MACVDCGSETSKPLKHLPLQNGWVELSEWTDYCSNCAGKEAVKMDEVFRKAKESVGNGAVS